MSSIRKHLGWVGFAALLAAAQVLVLACSDDEPAVRRNLVLRVYNSDSGQSEGFPPAVDPDVFDIRVRIYQNGQERQDLYPSGAQGIVFPYEDLSGRLPQLEFGENYQLIVEGLDRDANVLADGATPVFDFFEETAVREIQVFVSPLYSVEYASALYVTDAGLVSVPSEFEGPFVASQLGMGAEDLGGQRAGHTLTQLPDGRVLAIGGARLTATGGIGGSPFARFVDTVEIFDPSTGYWTLVRDLDADPIVTETSEQAAPMRLSVARAFHTATRLDDGRILVAGGFWDDAGTVNITNAAEIIDLNKGTITLLEPGSFDLIQPRAMHTAHLINGQVYVFGGVSRFYGNPSYLVGVEVFRPEDGFFERAVDAADGSSNLEMLVPRGMHRSVQLADGVLVIGGRTTEGATPTMEFFEISNDGLSRYFTDAGALPSLQSARFGHEALLMARDFENSSEEDPVMYIAVAGGYTAPDTTSGDLLRGSGLSDTIEFVNERDFTVNHNLTMEQPRAHFAMVETSITRDLLILGGIGSGGVSREIERHVRSQNGGFPLRPRSTLNPEGAGGAGELHMARAFPGVVQLGTHNVMVVGGWDGTANTAVCGSSSLTAGCTAELANPGDLFVLGWLY